MDQKPRYCCLFREDDLPWTMARSDVPGMARRWSNHVTLPERVWSWSRRALMIGHWPRPYRCIPLFLPALPIFRQFFSARHSFEEDRLDLSAAGRPTLNSTLQCLISSLYKSKGHIFTQKALARACFIVRLYNLYQQVMRTKCKSYQQKIIFSAIVSCCARKQSH